MEEAKKQSETLLEIIKLHFDENHPILIKFVKEIGNLYFSYGQEADCLICYLKADSLAKKHLGHDHKIRIKLLNKIATCRLILEKRADAQLILEESLQIMRRWRMETTLQYSTTQLDNLRLLDELGKINRVVKDGEEFIKLYVKYLKDNSELEQKLYFRKKKFAKILHNFYKGSVLLLKMSLNHQQDFFYLKSLCDSLYVVLFKDLKKLIKGFMKGEYPILDEVVTMFVKGCCMRIGLIMTPKAKIDLVQVLDRFKFELIDTSGDQTSKNEILRKTMNEIVVFVLEERKNPFESLSQAVGKILDGMEDLKKLLNEFHYSREIKLDIITDNELRKSMEKFRSFLVVGGFSKMRAFMLEYNGIEREDKNLE